MKPVIARVVRKWRWAGVLIICAIISCAFFAPIFEGFTLSDVASRQNQVYPWAYRPTERLDTLHYDQADTFYPWQVFMSRAIQSGEFPLWNPYSFSGQPFFANGQSGILYPPRIYLSLVASPPRVHDLLLLTHMILGGVMMFLLLDRVRLSFVASVFGAIAWMINSFMLAWMALEHYVVIHAWLPLALLLTIKTFKNQSFGAGVGLGLLLGLIFLGANVLFVVITFAMLGGYGLYLTVRRLARLRRSAEQAKGRVVLRTAILIAVPALITAGIAAVQLWPTWELVSAIERAPLTYTDLVKWKLPTSELRAFFLEPVHLIQTPLGTGEDPYHRMLFLGTPTAVLALIGFFRKHHLVAYMRGLAIVTVLAAIGTPLTWVAYRFLPGFGHLKPLGRVLFLFNFAAVILAAFGLEWLLTRLPRLLRWRPQKQLLLTARWVVAAALITVVVLQLRSVASWVMRYELYKEGPLYAETPLIKELPKDDLTRMLAVQPSFYGSSSMVFGIPNAGGYDSLVPTRITRLWRVVEGGSTEAVVNQSPTGAFATTFSIKSRFDLLPRLAINHLVTAPMPPVLGCKGAASESTALKLEKPISSAELSPLVGDWNGDGLDSIGFYDPGTSTFYLQNIEGGYSAVQFGSPGAGWLPLAGDWNGDRRDSPGLYDRGTSTFYFSDAKQLQYGPPGTSWIPIAGDWNADGSDTVGLYDPDKSEFHLKNPPKNRPEDDLVFTFGKSGEGWIPLAGDWNGDGIDSIGLYHPAESAFHLRNVNREGMTDIVVQYGTPGKNWLPLVGFWTTEASRARIDVVGLYDRDFGIPYLCSPLFFPELKLDHLYAGRDGDIYRVAEAFPRAYVVYQAQEADSPESALKRFTSPDFDATRSVVIESSRLADAGTQCKAADSRTPQANTPAEILDRSLNSMTLRVNTPRPGWLVVAESWDEGWTATIDDQPATLMPGNYAFRALCVPEGEHIVRMTYRPTSFMIGRLISGATLVVVLVLVGIGGFRRIKTA